MLTLEEQQALEDGSLFKYGDELVSVYGLPNEAQVTIVLPGPRGGPRTISRSDRLLSMPSDVDLLAHRLSGGEFFGFVQRHVTSVPRKSSYARKLITVKEAARILGIAESTLRGRKAGTEKLTRIKYGAKSVRMIEQEVEAHVANLIDQAQKQSLAA